METISARYPDLSVLKSLLFGEVELMETADFIITNFPYNLSLLFGEVELMETQCEDSMSQKMPSTGLSLLFGEVELMETKLQLHVVGYSLVWSLLFGEVELMETLDPAHSGKGAQRSRRFSSEKWN